MNNLNFCAQAAIGNVENLCIRESHFLSIIIFSASTASISRPTGEFAQKDKQTNFIFSRRTDRNWCKINNWLAVEINKVISLVCIALTIHPKSHSQLVRREKSLLMCNDRKLNPCSFITGFSSRLLGSGEIQIENIINKIIFMELIIYQSLKSFVCIADGRSRSRNLFAPHNISPAIESIKAFEQNY